MWIHTLEWWVESEQGYQQKVKEISLKLPSERDSWLWYYTRNINLAKNRGLVRGFL